MKWAWCSYCGRPSGTRDHILPQAWGRLPPDVRNTRPACARCNIFRGTCGHCPAAMAALRAVVGFSDDDRREIDLARLWGWCGVRAQRRAAVRVMPSALEQVASVWPPMATPAHELRP